MDGTAGVNSHFNIKILLRMEGDLQSLDTLRKGALKSDMITVVKMQDGRQVVKRYETTKETLDQVMDQAIMDMIDSGKDLEAGGESKAGRAKMQEISSETQEKIIKCKKCGTYIHIENKRYCCGIDYLGLSQIPELPPYEEPKRRKTPKKLRESVLERDGFKCVKCNSKDNLHVHHKVAMKDGGEHTADNLMTLCDACHAEEHKDEQQYPLMKSTIKKTKSHDKNGGQRRLF